jgi:glutathione S-transferase
MGERPCGADATVFPFMAHALCPLFETAILTCAVQRPNLVAYRDRLMAQYFPAFADTAASPAHGV